MSADSDQTVKPNDDAGSPIPRKARTRRSTRLIVGAFVAVFVVGLVVRYASDDGQNSTANTTTAVSSDNKEVDPSTTALQLLSEGKPKKAVEFLEDAVTKDPSDSLAWFNLGAIYQTNFGNNAKAIDAYTRSINANAENITAYFNRGFAHWNEEDLEDAAADFKKVIDLKKGNAPKALMNLGEITILLGDVELGAKYIEEAKQLDPSLK